MRTFLQGALIWILIISGITYYSIFVTIMIPAIRLRRKVYWSDWLGLTFNQFSYLKEYKAVCEEHGFSLVWHRICWSIFFFACFSITAFFLIYLLIDWVGSNKPVELTRLRSGERRRGRLACGVVVYRKRPCMLDPHLGRSSLLRSPPCGCWSLREQGPCDSDTAMPNG